MTADDAEGVGRTFDEVILVAVDEVVGGTVDEVTFTDEGEDASGTGEVVGVTADEGSVSDDEEDSSSVSVDVTCVDEGQQIPRYFLSIAQMREALEVEGSLVKTAGQFQMDLQNPVLVNG